MYYITSDEARLAISQCSGLKALLSLLENRLMTVEKGSANERLRTVACGFLMNLTYGNGKLKLSSIFFLHFNAMLCIVTKSKHFWTNKFFGRCSNPFRYIVDFHNDALWERTDPKYWPFPTHNAVNLGSSPSHYASFWESTINLIES